jgi:Zn-dependent membrane protease YugP
MKSRSCFSVVTCLICTSDILLRFKNKYKAKDDNAQVWHSFSIKMLYNFKKIIKNMSGYYLIIIVTMLVSWLVSSRLKSKFEHYSKVYLRNGMSGKEIAEKMLHDNGIYDVQVISVPGQLTDHYNPANKTVNLSEGVYMQRNAAAAAVAAHECGHAVQHAVGYSMLQLRSKLVPMVNISSTLSQFVLFAGIAVMALLEVFKILVEILLF